MSGREKYGRVKAASSGTVTRNRTSTGFALAIEAAASGASAEILQGCFRTDGSTLTLWSVTGVEVWLTALTLTANLWPGIAMRKVSGSIRNGESDSTSGATLAAKDNPRASASASLNWTRL